MGAHDFSDCKESAIHHDGFFAVLGLPLSALLGDGRFGIAEGEEIFGAGILRGKSPLKIGLHQGLRLRVYLVELSGLDALLEQEGAQLRKGISGGVLV